MKAIMRCKKLSSMGSVASSLQHCYRERETPNAVPDRTPQNEHGKAKTTDEAMGRLRDLLPAKRRKDAVLAVEYVMTASPEWWEKASKAQQLEFFNQSHKWLASKVRQGQRLCGHHPPGRNQPPSERLCRASHQDGRLSARNSLATAPK